MAQTTARQTAPSSSGSISGSLVLSTARRPLLLRRLLAWTLEIGLLVGSATLPWYAGEQVRRAATAPGVPPSAVVGASQDAIARTLGLPKPQPRAPVPPLTNLLWFSALGLPLILAGSQLYWLATAGKTLPKHWLGLRVVTLDGTPASTQQILLRELIGRWGLPTLVAYGLWLGSGAFPQLGILGGLTLLALAAEGATLVFNPSQRAFHDRLASTQVVPGRGVYVPIKYRAMSPMGNATSVYPANAEPNTALSFGEEIGGLTSVIWVPRAGQHPPLQQWLRQYPALVLGGGVLAGLSLLMVGIVGIQLYTQQQVTQRNSRQQNDDLFLALVDTLSVRASTAAEQQAAILALASSRDPRTLPLLVDLLGQARDGTVLDALQQALVTTGADALLPLQRLNQTLASDQTFLGGDQRRLAQQRQQTVKRTLAKLLTLQSGQLGGRDLSHTHLGQVVAGPDAFRLVLDHLDLAGVIWQGAVLSGASFRQSHFFTAGPDQRPDTYDDRIADLSGSDLTAADLSQTQLRYVRFQGSSLLRADLSGSQAVLADFSQANLGSARLISANFSQANFEQASLVGADLTDSNLTEARLVAARLHQVQATGANLSGADLTRAEGRQANFKTANLSQANLSQMDLSEGQLQEANLSQVNLAGANLQNSNLQGIHLQGANLDGADFKGAIFSQPSQPGPNSFIQPISDLKPQEALAGVDFSKGLNLSADQLAYICAQDGIHPACPDDDP